MGQNGSQLPIEGIGGIPVVSVGLVPDRHPHQAGDAAGRQGPRALNATLLSNPTSPLKAQSSKRVAVVEEEEQQRAEEDFITRRQSFEKDEKLQRSEEEFLTRRQKVEDQEDDLRADEAFLACRRKDEERHLEEEEQRLAEEDFLARRRKVEDEQQEEKGQEAEAEGQRHQQRCERAGESACVPVESAQTTMMERAVAQKEIAEFLKSHRFTQMGMPRRSSCGSSKTYPLHAAAEENNIEVVRAMVSCGAFLQPKDSSKKTPLDIAEECNKEGSHDLVLSTLRAGMR